MEEDKEFLRQDSDYRTLKAFLKAECIYDVTIANISITLIHQCDYQTYKA